MRVSRTVLILAMFELACASTAPAPQLQQPETSTGFREIAPSRAERFMVSTANPEATAAALDVLRVGGSAVDAAI
ncbi:MAG: gamma-glutamyltransferase, partial [Myxococcota bacterium]